MSIFQDNLNQCMNNISIDNELKEKILNIKGEDVVGEYSIKNRTYAKRKVYRYAMGFILCAMVLVITTAVGTYAFGGKNVWEVFFSKEVKEIPTELLDYNGQSYVIDDYTITLEQTLYESKTAIGYCVFSIVKKGGKPEVKLNKWSQSLSGRFGESNRFELRPDSSGGCIKKYEVIGDKLYEYISFIADGRIDLKITLTDYKEEANEAESNYKTYDFLIKESIKYKEYSTNDSLDLVMSPLGIAINGPANRGIVITLHYERGKEEVVVDENKGIGIGGSGESYEGGKFRSQYRFKEMKDIEKVDYIIYNGEKYWSK